MRKIIHTVHIHATPAVVYDALTTQGGLSGWWSTRVELDPGTGGVVQFTFHGDFHPRMKQTRLDRDRRVEWTCVGGHDNWQDNNFVFDLEDVSGETRLRFTQEYAMELPTDVYGTYNFNWGYYLNSLKQLCETGTGAPFEAET